MPNRFRTPEAFASTPSATAIDLALKRLKEEDAKMRAELPPLPEGWYWESDVIFDLDVHATNAHGIRGDENLSARVRYVARQARA